LNLKLPPAILFEIATGRTGIPREWLKTTPCSDVEMRWVKEDTDFKK
tara:strand:- start:6 stop:146 length:141 start_codon:yes stop_codon:yes gene_type:complete